MHDRMFVEVTEQAPAGSPALLLIHGFPFDHMMWQAQLETLSPICRVIAPDLRGFGQSKIESVAAAEGVDMATYAADLCELLDSLQVEEPVILCGFSMGGYILWQFAQRFPERVKALVLCGTRALADSAEVGAARIKTAEEVLSLGTDGLAKGMLPKLLAAETLANRPEIVRQVTTMIRQAAPTATAAALRGMARRPDMQSALGGFDWPALVLVGAEDAISPPAEMQAIAKRLPQGKFSEIPAAGHMTVLENPHAVNQALVAFVESLG